MRGAHLEVTALTKAYRGVTALDGVDLEVKPGELVGLIGPNGSGKSTAIDCIAGLQQSDSGRVVVDGEDVTGLQPHSMASRDVIRTFQATRVFATLSVRANLRASALGRTTGKLRLRALTATQTANPDVEGIVARLVSDLGLEHVADRPAGELSYGQRKLIEFATACVRPPRLLLLDEPIAAVNPTLANVLRDWIIELQRQGTSVLLIEHNIELVTDICERIVVLDHGLRIADGLPEEVISDPKVQEAYFGR